jgi:hypothetical protein
MRIKTGDAHNLYAAVKALGSDASLKLKDEVLLAAIINENILLPIAQGYERTRQKAFLQMRQAGSNEAGIFYKDAAAFDAEFSLRDLELRDVEIEMPAQLKTIKFDDLKPVKGEHFIPNRIWLKPIIEDWPQ